MNPWLRLIIYLVAAPLVGGLLAGWDRRVSARMQSRRGPPILQPFYDVLKLWQKQNLAVFPSQNYYVLFFLLLVIFTGALFFAGADLLLVIFALTTASIFFVLGAYKASSPYSFIGAERELIQMMAYEPMVLLTAIGMYMVTKTFTSTASPATTACWCWRCRGCFSALCLSLRSSSANRPLTFPPRTMRTRNWCAASRPNSRVAPWP